MSPFAKASTIVVGNNVHKKISDRLRLCLSGIVCDRSCIERRHVDIEPAPRVHQVPHHQSDNQSQRGDDLEVEQRFSTDAAHFAQIPHACDARHHGAEDHHRDEHRDQADEGIAERFHCDRMCRAEITERDREEDGKAYLHP
jgi:hypothetical protein